jgi:hypothetical protein
MVIGLVRGRHELNVTGNYIFEEVPNDKIFDLEWQRKKIDAKLNHEKVIHMYVTGLTICLVSVINYCKETGKKLTLWHYNRETDTYIRQNIS